MNPSQMSCEQKVLSVGSSRIGFEEEKKFTKLGEFVTFLAHLNL